MQISESPTRQSTPNFYLGTDFFLFPLPILTILFLSLRVVHPDTQRLLAETVVPEEKKLKRGEETKMEPIKFIILSNQILPAVLCGVSLQLLRWGFFFFSICLTWEKEPVSFLI
jgi:hypothetical protein